MEIKVCQSEEEVKVLAKLAHKIWNTYFLGIISQQQIDYMVEMYQSEKALKKAIFEDGYTYFTAYEQNVMIGYCGVKIEKDRLFLSKLYLDEIYRGKGLSSKLLQEAITFANNKKLRTIYLTCNKYNTHSLDVYKHKGFRVIDAVKTDIGKGFIMDDYILELTLS